MFPVRFGGALFVCACVLNVQCGGGDPLDYETAMSLARDHNTVPVKVTFSASPRYEAMDVRVNHAYQQLMEANVLKCGETPRLGTICTPGPAGDELTQDGSTDFTLVAGRWVPAAILTIQRTGGGSAVAEVRMAFEPGTLYHEFESAFDNIQAATSAQALSEKRQGRMMRAAFQRYEDGWHLESIQ
jgi:hypothetical protein